MSAAGRKLSAALVLALLAGQAAAAGELELAQESGCLGCHRGVAPFIGPAYKEIAGRYAGSPDAVTLLARHIVAGTGPAGVGWMADGKARLPFMPPNAVSMETARRLATWILDVDAEVVDPGRFVSERVTIESPVSAALELGVDQLRSMPSRELLLPTRSGAQSAFKGVRLRDVLNAAGLENYSHFDRRRSAIVATASDGWRTVFSWAEVFDAPAGEDILVYLEKDGAALGENDGRIALVAGGDPRPEARHLKWLRRIEVRRIAD